jgi:uncharacterized membrane protein
VELTLHRELKMSAQRAVGVVLLIVGIVLLIVGMNASNSLADQVSNTFTGRFTQETMWYIIGGIASGLIGLLMLLVNLRKGMA